MSKTEAFEVKFAGDKSINVEVNFSKDDAIQVPVNINSLDADKIAKKIADQLQLPEIDTTELASKDLERFWDVVPEDSEEIISEEDIHAAVEDIWIQTFNS